MDKMFKCILLGVVVVIVLIGVFVVEEIGQIGVFFDFNV